jgi:multicomponent Na+:H+ antiporter subunit B
MINLDKNIQIKENIAIKDDKLILKSLSNWLLLLLILFFFYIHFHGDVSPGGGFQSGVVITLAVIIASFTKSNNDFEFIISRKINNIIGIIGILIYISFAFLPLLFNFNAFDYSFLKFLFKEKSHFIAINLLEFSIMLIIFSSISRIINTMMSVLKNENIIDSSDIS